MALVFCLLSLNFCRTGGGIDERELYGTKMGQPPHIKFHEVGSVVLNVIRVDAHPATAGKPQVVVFV
jgi:hypothetical protein